MDKVYPGKECYYCRDYYLLEEKVLNEYLMVMRDNDLFPCSVPLYKRIVFRGFKSELPNVKKVDEVLYEVKIIHGFRVTKGGKRRKTNIIEC